MVVVIVEIAEGKSWYKGLTLGNTELSTLCTIHVFYLICKATL